MAKPEITELYLSQDVPAGQEVSAEMTPTAGRHVLIKNLKASGALQEDAVVRVVWDFGGTEESVWTFKDSHPAPVLQIDKSKVDGSRKLAILMGNAHAHGLYMSVLCQVKEHDNG